MKMMTRVNKTNVGKSAMLLAVLLLVGGGATAGFAKENISAGQSGDPGDGLDFSSGGGTTILSGDSGNNTSTSTSLRAPTLFGLQIALVPYFDANGLHFVIVVNQSPKAESVK